MAISLAFSYRQKQRETTDPTCFGASHPDETTTDLSSEAVGVPLLLPFEASKTVEKVKTSGSSMSKLMWFSHGAPNTNQLGLKKRVGRSETGLLS